MSERLSQAQLISRIESATAKIPIGSRYRHYKGPEYTVIGIALRESDNEPCVVYQAGYGEKVTFIRPVSNWFDEIETPNGTVVRFSRVPD